MSGKEKIPLPPTGEEDKPKEKPKYLFDFWEKARRVVIPGRDGAHIYMFSAKEGLYLIDSFYFIQIEDTLFKVGIDQNNGQPIHERGKVILVAPIYDNDDDKDTDPFIRGYTVKESDFEDLRENIDEMTFYFDATDARVYYRYKKIKTIVLNEVDEPFEEEWVHAEGMELPKQISEQDLKKMTSLQKEVEYPDYA